MIARGKASPAARDMDAEDALDMIAAAIPGLDRMDEKSFDSGDFPKAILSSSAHGDCTPEDGCSDRCCGCGGFLGTDSCYPQPSYDDYDPHSAENEPEWDDAFSARWSTAGTLSDDGRPF
jgi:hypothetical protein